MEREGKERKEKERKWKGLEGSKDVRGDGEEISRVFTFCVFPPLEAHPVHHHHCLPLPNAAGAPRVPGTQHLPAVPEPGRPAFVFFLGGRPSPLGSRWKSKNVPFVQSSGWISTTKPHIVLLLFFICVKREGNKKGDMLPSNNHALVLRMVATSKNFAPGTEKTRFKCWSRIGSFLNPSVRLLGGF